MKYFVIAREYSAEADCVVEKIQGEFDRYVFAMLFRDAYNKHYSSNAEVRSEIAILNQLNQ